MGSVRGFVIVGSVRGFVIVGSVRGSSEGFGLAAWEKREAGKKKGKQVGAKRQKRWSV